MQGTKGKRAKKERDTEDFFKMLRTHEVPLPYPLVDKQDETRGITYVLPHEVTLVDESF